MAFHTIDELETALREADYLPDRGLATALFLSLALEKPVLLEGEAGVGKTEIAKALAASLDTELIRLQCYEGIDVSQALDEWNYPRQLLEIRFARGGPLPSIANRRRGSSSARNFSSGVRCCAPSSLSAWRAGPADR